MQSLGKSVDLNICYSWYRTPAAELCDEPLEVATAMGVDTFGHVPKGNDRR